MKHFPIQLKANEISFIGRNDSTEPVRLTPAWESRNLPDDELNFKGMTMERAKLELDPPSDRFKIIFFILVLHGVGTCKFTFMSAIKI